MRTAVLVLALLAGATVVRTQTPAPAQAPRPDTEVFVAPLTMTGGTPAVGAPVNVSNNPGYDNQPSFTPDGGAVLFTSVRGGDQSDIYRYDVGGTAVARVTSTTESEYSPAVTPDGQHISVIRVESDGTQRLWQFTLAGGSPALVLERIKPVGYHAWLDARTLVLFVLGQPATLQVADTTTGDARIVASNIGRSLHRIPGRATASFVQRPGTTAGNTSSVGAVMEFDPKTGQATRLIETVPGAADADCAWTPEGWLLMAHGSTLHGWKVGTPPAWKMLTDLAGFGVKGISRLAVSPKGDRIALVATR